MVRKFKHFAALYRYLVRWTRYILFRRVCKCVFVVSFFLHSLTRSLSLYLSSSPFFRANCICVFHFILFKNLLVKDITMYLDGIKCRIVTRYCTECYANVQSKNLFQFGFRAKQEIIRFQVNCIQIGSSKVAYWSQAFVVSTYTHSICIFGMSRKKRVHRTHVCAWTKLKAKSNVMENHCRLTDTTNGTNQPTSGDEKKTLTNTPDRIE